MDALAELTSLAHAGFDIAHAFDAEAAAREPGLALLAGGPRCGILIGNTRALWPVFSAALREPWLAEQADPLEHYTERAIDTAFPAAPIYYSHRRYAGAYLPLQRLAVAAGLAALAPSQLVIHPLYGPWFALRAIVLVDAPPPARSPIEKPCSCGPACADRFAAARDSVDWRDWLAIRDSCALSAWRYSDEQIRYHYERAWPGTRR